MEKWLKETYYDPSQPGSFSAPYKLFKLAKEKYPDIKLKQVKEFLQKQDVYTVFKEPRYRFKRNFTISHKIDYTWQMDSLYMLKYKADNDMYAYICCAIDVFSRYVWVRPLKALHTQETAEVAADIFQEGRSPTFSSRTNFGSKYSGKDLK